MFTSIGDYQEWAAAGSPLPTQQQVDAANDAVTDVLRFASYAVDAEGLPFASSVRREVKRAANLQVLAIMRNDQASEESGGKLGDVTSASIGGVSYSLEKSATANPMQLPPDGSLCPQALRVLRNAYGITWGVGTYG